MAYMRQSIYKSFMYITNVYYAEKVVEVRFGYSGRHPQKQRVLGKPTLKPEKPTPKPKY